MVVLKLDSVFLIVLYSQSVNNVWRRANKPRTSDRDRRRVDKRKAVYE
jgi:hypothetical protein